MGCSELFMCCSGNNGVLEEKIMNEYEWYFFQRAICWLLLHAKRIVCCVVRYYIFVANLKIIIIKSYNECSNWMFVITENENIYRIWPRKKKSAKSMLGKTDTHVFDREWSFQFLLFFETIFMTRNSSLALCFAWHMLCSLCVHWVMSRGIDKSRHNRSTLLMALKSPHTF